MRQIKFRAWDKKENCWVGGFCIHKSGAFSPFWNPEKKEPTWWTDKLRNSRIILMQFTGLHDKNGKEIWEGDIVRVSPHNNSMKVIYDDHSAMFRTKGKGIPAPLVSWIGFDIEVVGNIYSNPELIEK